MKNTLRSLREAAGLTQEGVARHFGFTRSSVAQWERRKAPTTPEMGRLSDLARLYGCTPTDLIGAINGELSHGPRAQTHDYHERPMSSGGGVPLIDWSNLGNLTRMPATSLADIPTLGYPPAPHTPPGSFALTVIGDAMVGAGRDSYADGEFVYIDPAGPRSIIPTSSSRSPAASISCGGCRSPRRAACSSRLTPPIRTGYCQCR